LAGGRDEPAQTSGAPTSRFLYIRAQDYPAWLGQCRVQAPDLFCVEQPNMLVVVEQRG
jgi:hypothetical protein